MNFARNFFANFLVLKPINAYKNGHYVPLVFCLLPDKKQSTYQCLFNLISDKCTEYDLLFNPENIVIDFELAIHKAVKSFWKTASIIGCRFHLSQAWFRKLQSLGLTADYKEQNEKGKFLKYCFGLMFLEPSSVSDCFIYDLISIMPADENIQKFCDYLVDNYISEESVFPPAIWANCTRTASLRRTTNACESFHSKFNSSFYQSHPNIFQFIDILVNFQTEVYIKINTENKFQKSLRRNVKQKLDILQKNINDYNSNKISRLEFIKIMSYRFSPVA